MLLFVKTNQLSWLVLLIIYIFKNLFLRNSKLIDWHLNHKSIKWTWCNLISQRGDSQPECNAFWVTGQWRCLPWLWPAAPKTSPLLCYCSVSAFHFFIVAGTRTKENELNLQHYDLENFPIRKGFSDKISDDVNMTFDMV